MGNLFGTLREIQESIKNLEIKIDKKIDEKIDALEKKFAFERGTYFRDFKLIWTSERAKFEGQSEEWKACRDKDTEAIKYYQDPKVRERGSVRYYKDKFPEQKLFPKLDQSMGHLIPNDPSCSLAWLRALSIITGFQMDPMDPKYSPLFNMELRTFIEGGKSTSTLSDHEYPLKAWFWNYLQLPEHHQEHFDEISWSHPKKMIVTPIWDPNVEWKPGTGYKLMVAATEETYTWLLGKELEKFQNYHWFGAASIEEAEKATKFLGFTVKALADLLHEYGEKDFQEPGEEFVTKLSRKTISKESGKEEEDEVILEEVFRSLEDAIPKNLLSQISSVGSESGRNSENDSTRDSTKSSEPNKKIKDFKKNISSIYNGWRNHKKGPEKKAPENQKTPEDNETPKGNETPPIVHIPKLLVGENKDILVVDLGLYFKDKEILIPDPFLVVLKAAVSWSSYKGPKLLPACNHDLGERQTGSEVQKEDLIPEEIFSISGGNALSEYDDDSSSSSFDGSVEAVPTESRSDKTAVRVAVVTP